MSGREKIVFKEKKFYTKGMKQERKGTAGDRARRFRISGQTHGRGSNNSYRSSKAKASNSKKNRKGT